MDELTRVIDAFLARGDLTHVSLALWAGGATALCFALIKALSLANHELAAATREISAANRHVKEFVRQLARFNRRNSTDDAE